jgi:hypothetical protein
MLRLLGSTTGFFFCQDRAILISRISAGESWRMEITLIKAKSSCLNILLLQELLFTTPDTRLLTSRQPSE